MITAYMEHGFDAAVKRYETLKAKRPDDYDFSLGTLNQFGWFLLETGHIKDAIRGLQLSTAMYPDSADAFDALAGAYEIDGNVAMATANYEKAVQLDPGQKHAPRARCNG